MGYSLTIGEYSSTTENEDGEEYTYHKCDVVSNDDAPAFGEPTDYENQRWPSYTSWHNAMRELDMMDLMFDERNGGNGFFYWDGKRHFPLLLEHPGMCEITQAHVEYAENKLREYKEKYPTHRAEYPPPKPYAVPIFGDLYRSEDYVDDPEYDGALCRGEWLVYWLRWAFENCKRPAFVNG